MSSSQQNQKAGTNRLRISEMPEDRQNAVRQKNAKCARQYRRSKKGEEEEMQVMFQENEKRIQKLEKEVTKLSSALHVPKRTEDCPAKNGGSSKQKASGFCGDAF